MAKETKEVLLAAGPAKFTHPPWMGPRGWISVTFGTLTGGSTDWDEVTHFVRQSYRLIAPKTLSRRLA